MPTGVIINSLSILLGGLAGGLFGHTLSEQVKQQLNLIFGLCAMGMGIAAIGLMTYLPAVIFFTDCRNPGRSRSPLWRLGQSGCQSFGKKVSSPQYWSISGRFFVQPPNRHRPLLCQRYRYLWEFGCRDDR